MPQPATSAMREKKPRVFERVLARREHRAGRWAELGTQSRETGGAWAGYIWGVGVQVREKKE